MTDKTADTSVGTKALQNVSSAIESIERDVGKLTDKGDLGSVSAHLTSLEGAKLEVATAFTLATLMYMALRAQGHSTVAGGDQPHPIHSELKRIKQYVERVNKAASSAQSAVSTPSDNAAPAEQQQQKSQSKRRADSTGGSARRPGSTKKAKK
jgi:hypothetical protein